MIDFLYLLPQSVLFHLISGWWCFKDLGRLDSAVCLKKARSMFEQTLHATPLRHTEREVAINDSLALWIIKRRVKHKELFVEKEFEKLSSEIERKLFQSTGSSLRALVVDSSYSCNSTDSTVLNLCTFATGLELCIIRSVISDGAACFLLARNERLRVLSLNGPDLLYRLGRMNCCARLTDLTIVKDVSAASLGQFLEVCSPKLERLCLPQCQYFSAKVFEQLQHFQQLRVLHIAGLSCTDLAKVCVPSLVELKVYFHAYNADTLAAIAKSFPSLLSLLLDSLGSALTTIVLLQLLGLMPGLRFLSAWNGVSNPPEKPFAPAIIKNSSQCNLERLHASIRTEFDLTALLTMCPGLFEVFFWVLPTVRTALQGTTGSIRNLHVHSDINVTDKNVAGIGGLHELRLVYCWHLTDQGLMVLAKNNPELRVLELKNIGCGTSTPPTSVSYKGLFAFLDLCPRLTSVTYMFNISKVNGTSTGANIGVGEMLHLLVRKSYPNLQHFECNIA